MDIADLIKKVEKATGPDREIDGAAAQCVGIEVREHHGLYRNKGERGWVPVAYYTASVDAVISLIEEKMPGWEWLLRANPSGRRYDPVPGDPDHFFEEKDAGLFMGNLHAATRLWEQPEETFPGYAPTPALALLLAFLRAWEAADNG